MQNIIIVSQLVISVLLIIFILLQPKGEGLSQNFGGQTAFYKTRRGMEKLLFSGTLILIFLFLIFSLLVFLLK